MSNVWIIGLLIAGGGALVLWHTVSQTKYFADQMLDTYQQMLQHAREERERQLARQEEEERLAQEAAETQAAPSDGVSHAAP